MRFSNNKMNNLYVIAAAAVCASLASASGGINHHESFALDMLNGDAAQAQSVLATPEFQAPSIAQSADQSALMPIVIIDSQTASQAIGFGPALGDTLDNQGRSVRLNRLDAELKPDTIAVVPLPSAAFAGLGLLCGIAGVRMIKSRR